MSIFTKNLIPRPKSSWFPLSHTNTLSLDMPYLVPVLCADVIPGDKWRISTEMFLRMMPMLSPMMQEVDVYCHYFFVPTRLTIMEYDKFFNPEEQDNVFRPFIYPSKLAEYITLHMGEYDYIPVDPSKRDATAQSGYELCALLAESSLADYLGIPVFSWGDMVTVLDEAGVEVPYYQVSKITAFMNNMSKFSAIPFLMYQKIYDEFYRDQTLEDSILELLDPNTDGYIKGRFNTDEPFDIIAEYGWLQLMSIRTRAWRKDYFTSALPTPQSGPDVHLPLTGDADVVLDPIGEGPVVYASQKLRLASTGEIDEGGLALREDAAAQLAAGSASVNSPVVLDPNGTLKADMSNVTSATINELRRAVRAQEFLERCARGGRRYIEMILAHFGVRSSDARLDRPEFLGGGRQQFTISEVLSHVGEDDNSSFVLGEMGGHGVSYGRSSYTKRYFEEHGFIFAIVSILPKASYQQGLARMWTRESIYDYAWPSFANLGEQEVLNKELYDQSGDPDGVFGYAPRYSEYKYIPSSVHGAMRSSLSYWHLGRIFSSAPALNADFVHPKPEELKRIFTVQTNDNNIVAFIKHHIQSNRRLPKYGIPTL